MNSMTAGYDPAFLATPLPLPHPQQVVRTLPYRHFTVLLDPERRLAAVTAVNIDGLSLRDIPREGDWHLDPRVPDDEQAGTDVYSDNDLDRGHLVRRRDPGWGEADAARAATISTFAYPNAAPQAAVFNQSKQLWLGLEDHVLGYAESTDQRVSVFTAPVLAEGDPPYRGIRIPLRFWKVAAWQSSTGLACAGFVLDQTDLVDAASGRLGAPPLGGFRTFQVTVSAIAGLTGIDFGDLVDADVLADMAARSDEWRELEEVAGIVL